MPAECCGMPFVFIEIEKYFLGSGGPVIARRGEAIQRSFLDCHGAEAPRNDGLSPVRTRLPAFLDKRPDWPYLTLNKGSFQTNH
jgi:hypothetical protein